MAFPAPAIAVSPGTLPRPPSLTGAARRQQVTGLSCACALGPPCSARPGGRRCSDATTQLSAGHTSLNPG